MPTTTAATSTSSANAAGITGATSELDLERLRDRVRELAVRPVEGGDGRPANDAVWETELNDTVNQLDRLMMMRESGLKSTASQKGAPANGPQQLAAVQPVQGPTTTSAQEQETTPQPDEAGKKKAAMEVVDGGVALLQRWSNEIAERTKRFQIVGRRLSLE